MMESEFIELFCQQKEAFLKEFEKKISLKNISGTKILDWFECWLREEKVVVPGKERDVIEFFNSFDDFIEEVLLLTQEMLAKRGIKMIYNLPGQQLGISESWKCLQVFGKRDIYYRIGRTRPRKGKFRGQELLVVDLVMDGHKKQVFMPLLSKKDEIEGELGEVLERELPKVEATGKYRLKLFLPFHLVRNGKVLYTANKLTNFVSVTKQFLNNIGVV